MSARALADLAGWLGGAQPWHPSGFAAQSAAE
jgi:hypothetical protein